MLRNQIRVNGDESIITVSMRDGTTYNITVDTDDLDRLNEWCSVSMRCRRGYANLYKPDGSKNGKSVRLHRFITGATDPSLVVDHIDRNILNNKKSNLRIVDHSTNAFNRKVNSNNKSGVIGVAWHSASKKWQAVVMVGNKQKYLGLYNSIEEAGSVVEDFRNKHGLLQGD